VPAKQWFRRTWLKLRSLHWSLQAAAALTACVLIWLGVNVLVQVARKPTELFFPVSGVLDKSPAETWREYGSIFRAHSTDTITPELLAALAQVEGAGNPVARTPWRWRLTEDPFDVYRPASTAVGMYQITDGTYALARRYCIHDHDAVEDGPWYAWKSCWFNWFYFRVVPSHAAEMTSAFLEVSVAGALRRTGREGASLRQRQDLAAVMHLCGVAAGESFARARFRPAAGPRCGGQNVGAYVARVRAMQRVFAALDR